MVALETNFSRLFMAHSKVALLLAFLSLPAFAQLNTFSNGEVADAGQVNENFQFLDARTLRNSERIESLETQILPGDQDKLVFLGYFAPSSGPADHQCKTATGNNSAHLATTEEFSNLVRLTWVPLPEVSAQLVSYGPYTLSVPDAGSGYEFYTGLRVPPNSAVPWGGKQTFYYTPDGTFSHPFYLQPEEVVLACVGYISP